MKTNSVSSAARVNSELSYTQRGDAFDGSSSSINLFYHGHGIGY